MLVFVYGTLKEGCCNHYVLISKVVHETPVKVTTVDKYPMYKSQQYFPYLEDQKGVGNHIIGELWEVEDYYEKSLDYFEGVPTLYKKGKITVQDESCRIYEDVNVYFRTKETETLHRNLINEWIEE